jgi:hypothetical protein
VKKPPNADPTLSVGVIVAAGEGVWWELTREEQRTYSAQETYGSLEGC